MIYLILIFLYQNWPIYGIDFGSEFIKIGFSDNSGNLEIIENKYSKRKVNSRISFENSFILFDIESKLNKNFTVSNLKMFIDEDKVNINKKYLNQHFNYEENHYIFNFNKYNSEDNLKNINLKVNKNELFLLKFNYWKNIIKNHKNIEFFGCVLSIPTSFRLKDRIFFYKIFDNLNIKLLGFINENLAAAVNFSLNRKDSISKKEILWIDIGSSSTKFSLIQHNLTQKGAKYVKTIKLIKSKELEGLGGFKIDHCLSEIIKNKTKDFNYDYKLLYNKVKKIKEILTVNREVTFNLNELLSQEYNIKVTIKRAEFNLKCKYIFNDILSELKVFLKENKIIHFNLESIEGIGGVTRTPYFRKKIKSIYYKNLGSRINSDDSVALGSSIFGNNYVENYVLQKLIILDKINFICKIQKDNKEIILFENENYYDSKKIIKISFNQEIVRLVIKLQDNDNNYDYLQIKIINNHLKQENLKLYLNFIIDSNGFPSLDYANLYLNNKIFESNIKTEIENILKSTEMNKDLLNYFKNLKYINDKVSNLRNNIEFLIINYKKEKVSFTKKKYKFMNLKDLENYYNYLKKLNPKIEEL